MALQGPLQYKTLIALFAKSLILKCQILCSERAGRYLLTLAPDPDVAIRTVAVVERRGHILTHCLVLTWAIGGLASTLRKF